MILKTDKSIVLLRIQEKVTVAENKGTMKVESDVGVAKTGRPGHILGVLEAMVKM